MVTSMDNISLSTHHYVFAFLTGYRSASWDKWGIYMSPMESSLLLL